MDPRHGRIQVMVQMPVVVQPEQVDRPERLEVAGAAQHVSGSREVVGVLHRGPDESEAEQHGEVVENRDGEDRHQRAVDREHGEGFELYPELVARVESLLKGDGGALERGHLFAEEPGIQGADDIAQDNRRPEEAGYY